VSEPCVSVCLHYLYPEPDRSFFSPRHFEIAGSAIVRSGLFGNAPDIAGVVIASDSMHMQFNERDDFSRAAANGLRVERKTPSGRSPEPRLEFSDGFATPPLLSAAESGFLLDLSGISVEAGSYMRLVWSDLEGRS